MFSLWHFLIHCYANLKISQGVSSKLCHLMICTADFSGETGSTNKHHPNLAIYLKGCFNPCDTCMVHSQNICCRLALDDFSPSNPSSSLQILNARCVFRNAVEFVEFWMATKESPKVGCRRSACKSTKSSPASRKRYVFWKTDGNNENT